MLSSDFLFPRFFVVPLANPSNFSHCKCFSIYRSHDQLNFNALSHIPWSKIKCKVVDGTKVSCLTPPIIIITTSQWPVTRITSGWRDLVVLLYWSCRCDISDSEEIAKKEKEIWVRLLINLHFYKWWPLPLPCSLLPFISYYDDLYLLSFASQIQEQMLCGGLDFP